MADKKRYDYHTEAAIATNPGELKRILRKLVREAVIAARTDRDRHTILIDKQADRIAKELVP